MTSNDQEITNHKSVTDNDVILNAVDALLTSAGFNKDELNIALDAIKNAKSQSLVSKKQDNKFWLEKTLIYPNIDECFIYKRATSVSGKWYLRIYDYKNNKPVVRSLKTTDKNKAIATARVMYMELKGKIDRNEKLQQITAAELIQKYDDTLKEKISPIPMSGGITPDHYKVKRYHLRTWREFLTINKLIDKPIDKIQSNQVKHFGLWLLNKPKQTAKHKQGRSVEVVNDTVNEIVRMYYQIAKGNYLSEGQIPVLERINQVPDDSFKRDILTEVQYEKFWKYLHYRYSAKKHNPDVPKNELLKRKIFAEFVLIMANVGFRSSELLGMKIGEISEGEGWDDDKRKSHIVMKVRKENSKTGKGRLCVAPVRDRVEKVKKYYKQLGVKQDKGDFLFINPTSKQRNSYGRMVFYNRLKKVFLDSGLQDEFDAENKSVSLYSFRHQYACWRLRFGDVPIHLLAKQMGTSVGKIESTYGHIMVLEQADQITKNQEEQRLKRNGVRLDIPEVLDDDYVPSAS